MVNNKRQVPVVFLLIVIVTSVHCFDLFVDPSSSYETGNGSEDQPFQSISLAISSFLENENENENLRLILFPGSYQGASNLNITLNSMNTEVISYSKYLSSNKKEIKQFNDEIVLFADSNSPPEYLVFKLIGTGSLHLDDIHFSNLISLLEYYSYDYVNQHQIDINNCFFNSIYQEIIFIEGISNLFITNCKITNCYSFFIYYKDNYGIGTVNLQNMELSNGPGVELRNVSISVDQCKFIEPMVSGITFSPALHSVNKISNCTFNAVDYPRGRGAGISIDNYELEQSKRDYNIFIENCLFSGFSYEGGGLFVDNIRATLENVTFDNCEASLGSAVYISRSSIGIANSLFSNNLGEEGTIYLIDNSTLQLSNSIFDNNESSYDTICESDLNFVVLTNDNNNTYGCNVVINNFSSYSYHEVSYYSSSYSDSGTFNYLYGYIFIVVQSFIVSLVILGVGVFYIYTQVYKGKEDITLEGIEDLEELGLEDDEL